MYAKFKQNPCTPSLRVQVAMIIGTYHIASPTDYALVGTDNACCYSVNVHAHLLVMTSPAHSLLFPLLLNASEHSTSTKLCQ